MFQVARLRALVYSNSALFKGLKMKTKITICAAVLGSSLGASALADVKVLSGNKATATIDEAAVGTLIETLDINLTKTLVFPDLVIPGDAGIDNTVRVFSDALGGLALEYEPDFGKPNGEDGLVDIDADTSTTGTVNGHNKPSFGEITITGHQDKAIHVTVVPVTNTSGDGYTIDLDLDDSYADSASVTPNRALDNSGNYVITFGGTLTANNTASKGRAAQDIEVTVNYF